MEEGLQKGIQKGMLKGSVESKIEIVKKMIKLKFSIDDICAVTELSVEKVKKIANEK